MKSKTEAKLAQALAELVSQQMGPPSTTHAHEWSVAMNLALEALRLHYGGLKCKRR